MEFISSDASDYDVCFTYEYVRKCGGDVVVYKTLTDTRAGLADYVPNRALEARQYSPARCGSPFTTLNGANYTTYCDQNIRNNGEQQIKRYPPRGIRVNRHQTHRRKPFN